MKHFFFSIRRLALLVLATVALSAIGSEVQASHNLGGELTYRYMGNNMYRFRVTFYRDCSGISIGTAYATGFNTNGVPSLNATYALNMVDEQDITPECTPITGGPGELGCNNDASGGNGANGSVGRVIYETPNIDFTNVPAIPAAGYTFTAALECCRNSNDNTSCFSDLVFRCTMYPYINQAGVSVTPIDPLYQDNSPTFAEPPNSLQILNATDTTSFSNNATDIDLDEILYGFSVPWGSTTPSMNPNCGYNAPNTVNNPFPGILPNQPDSITGSMDFVPNTVGNYIVVIRVRSYRCGQLISEVFRDFMLQTLAVPAGYGTNERPILSQPFLNGTSVDTFFAGQTVNFLLSSFDGAGVLYNIGNYQNVYVYFTGIQFGTNFTSTTTGCPYPPCATLRKPNTNPAIPPVPIVSRGDTLGYGFSESTLTNFSVGAEFIWDTDCSNLPLNDCGVTVNRYTFVVTAKDDYCPAPGKLIQPITIVLVPPTPVPSPDGICVNINPDSSVTLSWALAMDTLNTFTRYVIHRGFSPATMAPYDSTSNYTDTTWTDVNANAFNGPLYYKVVTRSSCYDLEDPVNNAFTPILLNINPTSPFTATLTWSPISTQPSGGQSAYRLMRRVLPGGAFQQVATVPFAGPLTYADSAYVCNAQVEYQIEIDDSFGNCTSRSNIVGALFADPANVVQAEIFNISADTTDNIGVTLTWRPNPDQDTRGYLVTRFQCGTNAIQQQWQVLGRFNNTFTDPISADSGIACYGIAAFDSCYTDTAPGLLSTIHQNIWLRDDLDRCEGTVSFLWNEYVGWDTLGGVRRYDIYRAEEGSAYTFLDSIGFGEETFTDTGLIKGLDYCYVIYAVNGSDSTIRAMSNKVCFNASVFTEPTLAYIRYASVTEDGDVELAWLSDSLGDVARYIVQRATEGGPFEDVGSVGPVSVVGPGFPYKNVEFVDRGAATDLQSYTYRLVVVDSCERPSLSGQNVATTVFLDGSATQSFENDLEWNPYGEWPFGVSGYALDRNIPDVDPLGRRLALVPGTQNAYQDNIQDFYQSEGTFCYRLLAIEQGPNQFGFSDSAYSNLLCITQPPKIYTPNAMIPEGNNPIFFPVRVFALDDNYELTIYNRWGQEVFKSTDWNQGWDGTFNGEVAQAGIYMYNISFKGRDKRNYDQRGSITLIR